MGRVLRTFWSLFWAVFWMGVAAASIAGLYNVFRDDHDVQQMAEAVACAGKGEGCRMQRFRQERWPLSSTFEFFDEKQEWIQVRCSREYALLGEYACAVRERGVYTGPIVLVPPRSAPTVKAKGGVVRKQSPPSASVPAPSAAPVGDGGV
jgi:hypothetical protein